MLHLLSQCQYTFATRETREIGTGYYASHEADSCLGRDQDELKGKQEGIGKEVSGVREEVAALADKLENLVGR